MKNLDTTKKFLNIKMKGYYGGVALMALMSASPPSHAMEINDEVSRARCLWHLEQEPSKKKVFQTKALTILRDKVFNDNPTPDSKLVINYIKKLGEFLKENPKDIFNHDIVKIGVDLQEHPISKIYNETLAAIPRLRICEDEKKLQTFKLKIFYSHLPSALSLIDINLLKTDIRTSFTSYYDDIKEINKSSFKYLMYYFFENDIDQLPDLLTENKDELLKGKINCKLGVVGEKKQKEQFYKDASKSSYSLAKYYLAELYNNKDAGFYRPREAWVKYSDIVNAGAKNTQGKYFTAYPLAAYRLAKLHETGDNTFDLLADKNKALECYNKAATLGHPYAQHDLATTLLETQKDKEGIELLQKAAESGYSKAQLLLAQKYEEKFEKTKNIEDKILSQKWYKLAATQGEKEAFYPSGCAYEGDKDYENAISFYEKSGDWRVHVPLGKLYLNKGNNSLAKQHFEQAAKDGKVDGNYYLGLMELETQGAAAPNLENIFKNFWIAAKQNHSEASLQLGLMEQFGIGTPQNYNMARKYYKKADTPAALYHLGSLYKRGLGISKNMDTTLELWEKAANLGHSEAAYEAGKAHLYKWLDEKDMKRTKDAEVYLKKAADLNHADALYLLGVMQEYGIGCPQDPPKEVQSYYGKAADAGHASGHFKLGQFYEKNSAPENSGKAISHYKLAANQLHEDAINALKKLLASEEYTNEFACYKNLEKADPLCLKLNKEIFEQGNKSAIAWFEKSSLEGDPKAQKYFGKLLEAGGKLVTQDTIKAFDLYQQVDGKGSRFAKRRLSDLKQAHLYNILNRKDSPLISESSNLKFLNPVKSLDPIIFSENQPHNFPIESYVEESESEVELQSISLSDDTSSEDEPEETFEMVFGGDKNEKEDHLNFSQLTNVPSSLPSFERKLQRLNLKTPDNLPQSFISRWLRWGGSWWPTRK